MIILLSEGCGQLSKRKGRTCLKYEPASRATVRESVSALRLRGRDELTPAPLGVLVFLDSGGGL